MTAVFVLIYSIPKFKEILRTYAETQGIFKYFLKSRTFLDITFKIQRLFKAAQTMFVDYHSCTRNLKRYLDVPVWVNPSPFPLLSPPPPSLPQTRTWNDTNTLFLSFPFKFLLLKEFILLPFLPRLFFVLSLCFLFR